MPNGIRIGISGYGNLGRGVDLAIGQNPDMDLVAVFTRRPPDTIKIRDKQARIVHIDNVESYKDKIDVMILCGGSATDLPEQGPQLAAIFNTIDSFDNHGKIPQYFASIDRVAKDSGRVGIISVGWDPGLFSLNRMISQAVMPKGKTYTFWGKGVSQGHSDAIRRVEGVVDAVQYTIPLDEAIDRARSGDNPELVTDQRHLRQCFVVAAKGADREKIDHQIKTMPNYFADYETTVTFITKEELAQEHSAMPHGGFVIRSGKTGAGEENTNIYEFSLKLESNPEFTASVLLAYARAAYRLNKEGRSGAFTVLDIPPAYLSPKDGKELRKELL
ncbi:MAG TPA: diaminopimelate dehydrogenase [Bacillota bacterium]|nr:diaminopimelate dehydrogenase [Bacillota bacterium]